MIKRVSRIDSYKEREIFIFIASHVDKWEYGDIILRNIIQYVIVDNFFHIDFLKHEVNRKKYIIKAIFGVSLMVFVSLLTIYLTMYFNIHSIFDFRYLLSLILIGYFEFLALNNYGKIHKESDMKKYNSSLASIDASELSTKSVIFPHRH